VIEYRDLHKTFDVPVLAGLSFTVETGETLGIIGPSGTGKSVLLKTTIGLIVPDLGDVFVDGQSVFRASRQELQALRRKVGYVFQNAALFDSMNVYENVAFGLPEGTAKVLGHAEVVRRVSGALEDVNLDPDVVLAKMPSELSGGMRKRVGLARAIVGRPEILLYDEPVTGLDPINTAGIDKLITDIGERSHVTSIVVTHDIEGALLVCNRIALLEGGRLHFIGTPEEFRHSDVPLVRAFADREAASAAAREMEAAMRGPARRSTEERHP
jgi:phospholipid/cholesterol/gamma-HCH transport system ATP-binding protein